MSQRSSRLGVSADEWTSPSCCRTGKTSVTEMPVLLTLVVMWRYWSVSLTYSRRSATNDATFGCPGTSKSRSSDSRESCLLYTSDAADDLLCVDLGGRRIIKKKKKNKKQ